MYPFLLPEIFNYALPLYDILLVIGIILMFIYVIHRLEKMDGFTRQQTNRIIVLIFISLIFSLGFSYVFDGIFHSIKEGKLSFGTISFLGGLIGGLSSFLILLKYYYKDDNKDVRKIMNTLITGIVLAHAFGRIGCFFAGCCYGIPTDSFLGVVFPYGHAHDMFPGTTILPTQLFESAFLFILFIGLNKIEKLRDFEIEVYLISYGVWRIFIEFFRGDERGSVFPLVTTEYNVFPTPSQFISVLMVIFGVYLLQKILKKIDSVE